MPRRIILKTGLPPGDVCTLTAAIESLHYSYPGQYVTDVRTNHDELFHHNPHVTKLREDRAQVIELHYTELLNTCDTVPNPFLRGYTHDLGRRLGIPLELQTNRPHLYLSEIEQAAPPYAGDLPPHYWLVTAGVKRDFTAKQWPVEYFQDVVSSLRGKVQFVQVGAAGDDHPPLEGAINLIGKTTLRQLLCLAYHCDGGLGPITLLQHLCAAFQKPYVAMLGGREPVTWTQYPLQTTLHTLGKLPCCRTRACWRSRVVRLNDGEEHDDSLCDWPVVDMQRPVGKCMAVIKPPEVVVAIEVCYWGEALGSSGRTIYTEHQRRLHDVISSAEPYPSGRFHGRGIVICAGGETYLTCAYVCIRMLHGAGCRLPVQVWHLGPDEMPPEWRGILEGLGIKLVDALEVARRFPSRRLEGWAIKCYALLNCPFREIVLLDADNMPLVDPATLFDSPEYINTGALFWPDRGRLSADREIWKICGLEYRDAPEFEAGQIVVDKGRCWQALRLAMHMNEWGEFYYRHIHGDKETFHLAWRKLNQPFAMAPPLADAQGMAIYQHDFSGRKIFQHRNGGKWALNGENPRVPDFDREDECLKAIAELRDMLARLRTSELVAAPRAAGAIP